MELRAGHKRKAGCVVIATTIERAALMLRRRALRGSKQEDRADSAASASSSSSSMKRRRRSSSTTHCRCCFRCAGFDDGDDFRRMRRRKRAVWTATEEGGERGAGDRVGAMLCDVPDDELSGILSSLGKAGCMRVRDLALALLCSQRSRRCNHFCTRLAGASSSSSSACGKISRALRSFRCAACDEDCRAQSTACTSRCRVCGVASCDACWCARTLEAASADLHSSCGSSSDHHRHHHRSQGDIACTLALALSSLCNAFCDSVASLVCNVL